MKTKAYDNEEESDKMSSPMASPIEYIDFQHHRSHLNSAQSSRRSNLYLKQRLFSINNNHSTTQMKITKIAIDFSIYRVSEPILTCNGVLCSKTVLVYRV